MSAAAEEARRIEAGCLNVIEYAIVIDNTVALTVPGTDRLPQALAVFDAIRQADREGGQVNLLARTDLSGQRPAVLLAQYAWGRS